MKDHISHNNSPVSIFTFLQDFKATYNTFYIHEKVAKWLFKHYFSALVESVMKAQVAFPDQTGKS